jgi:hypothetical protein
MKGKYRKTMAVFIIGLMMFYSLCAFYVCDIDFIEWPKDLKQIFSLIGGAWTFLIMMLIIAEIIID